MTFDFFASSACNAVSTKNKVFAVFIDMSAPEKMSGCLKKLLTGPSES
jgi:hypothetical protein